MSDLQKAVVVVITVAILAIVTKCWIGPALAGRLTVQLRRERLIEALKSLRRNGQQRLRVLLMGLVAVILFGSVVALVRQEQAKSARPVPLDATGKLDAAESLGASMGTC